MHWNFVPCGEASSISTIGKHHTWETVLLVDVPFLYRRFHCNLCMFQLFLMIICMLLWLWSRKDLNHPLVPFLAVLLTVLYYRAVMLRVLQFYSGFDLWTMLLVKFGLVCVVGIPTLQMYTTMSPPKQ